MSKKLEEYVVTIPDFPEPGIMFRDITSVIQDPAWSTARLRLKSMWMRSSPVRRSSLWMT